MTHIMRVTVQILASLNIGAWAYMTMPIAAEQETPILQVSIAQHALHGYVCYDNGSLMDVENPKHIG